MHKALLLSSCRAKIARADEHLSALYEETDAWTNAQPCTVTRESHREGREHLFRVKFNVQPNVWRWGILLGDALHDLRCALDHIIYSIAIRDTGKDPPDDDARLMFPICSEPRFFQDARTQRRIVSLSESARAAIERVQPYNRTRPSGFSALWTLGQLNDIDKHRTVHIVPVATYVKEGTVGAPEGSYEVFARTDPVMDGAVVVRLILAHPDPDVYVDLRLGGGVVLGIDTPRPFSVHPTMRAIRKEVVLICRYLSRFL